MKQIDKQIKKFGKEMASIKGITYVEVKVNTDDGMSYEYNKELDEGEER